MIWSNIKNDVFHVGLKWCYVTNNIFYVGLYGFDFANDVLNVCLTGEISNIMYFTFAYTVVCHK